MSAFDPHRYTITVKLVNLDEGEHFEAVVAELPDLVEYGETHDGAYSLAVESIASLMEAAREQKREFPPPMPSQAMVEFSGRVTLRMAKSLHSCASRLADQDGVSLNSWIVEAVAARVGGGVAGSASTNVYGVETVHAFLYSQRGDVFMHSTVGTTWRPDVQTANQIIELKGIQKQLVSSNRPGPLLSLQ